MLITFSADEFKLIVSSFTKLRVVSIERLQQSDYRLIRKLQLAKAGKSMGHAFLSIIGSANLNRPRGGR
jgi:hypothetical protein